MLKSCRAQSIHAYSRRDPDFCDGRRSFPTNENSNLYRQGRRRWISLITNPLNCWAPVPQSHINMASLGQTSSDYPIYRQILERSAKSKIPDRLGLSLHMKTRLYDQGRIALRSQSSRDKIINSLRSRPLFSWQARSFFQILKKERMHAWTSQGSFDLRTWTVSCTLYNSWKTGEAEKVLLKWLKYGEIYVIVFFECIKCYLIILIVETIDQIISSSDIRAYQSDLDWTDPL